VLLQKILFYGWETASVTEHESNLGFKKVHTAFKIQRAGGFGKSTVTFDLTDQLAGLAAGEFESIKWQVPLFVGSVQSSE
jgi:hypothetical protein